jgi:hypothetical protein
MFIDRRRRGKTPKLWPAVFIDKKGDLRGWRGDKKLEANFDQCSSIGDVGKTLKLKANFGQCLVDRTRDFGKKKTRNLKQILDSVHR